MPTQTGSLFPAYATPRFCVDHILRDEGISALSGWTAASGFPIDRLLDNQRSLIAKHDTAEAVTLELVRGISSSRLGYNRVVIYGSNFHDNQVRVSLEKSDDDVVYTDINHAIAGVGYGQAEYDLAPPNVIDWELDTFYHNRYFHLVLSVGLLGFKAPEMSELWLTRTLQPVTGVAHRWTNGILPAVTASETSAKLVTHSIDGAQRARFAISWDRLANGADLELLRYVARKAGIRRNVLLYEHADFGTDPVVIDSFDDHTSYSLVNLTALDNATGAPGGNDDAVDFTSVASGQASLIVYSDEAVPLDLTDTVLEFWTRFDDALTVADAEASFFLRLFSANPATGTGFALGNVVTINSTAGHFYKIAFDPSTWGSPFDLTGAPDSRVDLTRVSRIDIVGTPSAAGNIIRHAKFYMRRKRQVPVPCFLTSFEEVQVGTAPSAGAGPLYNVTMHLEEALA